MKVTGSGQTQATGKSKKSGKASGTENFSEYMASGPRESASPSTTHSIAMVDALLAVQGAEDPTARGAKNRMRQRATHILDKLDNLRMLMLSGGLTVGHMVDIADVVASHRERINDPALTAIMDEIDLRAQVELAKIRAALDRQSLKRQNGA